MMNDRRRNPRVAPPQETIATVKATVPAKILDLSVQGMQVEVASTLRPGVDCNVSVPVPTGNLKLRARVERCRAQSFTSVENSEGGMLYCAGLSFIKPSAEDLEALEDAIVEFSLSEVPAVGKGDNGANTAGPIKIRIAPEHVNHS